MKDDDTTHDDEDRLLEAIGRVAAKYGLVRDDGRHAFRLHDPIPACERSVATGGDVEIVW